jgi:hypothetical protein
MKLFAKVIYNLIFPSIVKMCKKSNCCCDCIVVFQKNPPVPPAPPMFPPNANTVQEVISRSCAFYRKFKKCACIVRELYCVNYELQNAYRVVNNTCISSFYSETAIVSYNGTLLVGRAAISTGLIEPLILGQVSVNPDFTTLTYQPHSDCLITQYGTYMSTSTSTTGAVTTTTYNVIATWTRICDRWMIVNQVLTSLLV